MAPKHAPTDPRRETVARIETDPRRETVARIETDPRRETVARIETFTLDGTTPVVDQWGFLRARVPVTRTGVLLYQNADGSTRREYRPPEEVFAADSIASLNGVPLVFEHPDGDGAVTPRNAKRAAVGFVTDPRANKEAGRIDADITVMVDSALEALKAGTHRELSCGYLCKRRGPAGVTPEGEPYDLVQYDIRYNHVAQTRKGRAGSLFALPRLDGEDGGTLEAEVALADPLAKVDDLPDVRVPLVMPDAITVDSTDQPATGGRDPLAHTGLPPVQVAHVKLTIDGTEHDIPEAVHAHIEKLKATLDSANDALKAAPSKDAIKAEVAAELKARTVLERTAEKVCGAEFKCDSLSDTDIKVAVIAKLAPGYVVDGRTAEQHHYRYEAEMARLDESLASKATADRSRAALRLDTADLAKLTAPAKDPLVDFAEKARAQFKPSV